MPITELLEQNARLYPDDVSLVEVNPEVKETRRSTWKEYELMEPNPATHYRREITWHVFNEKANRAANMLLSRGVHKGDKVAILLMNCLDWLPLYFGILKLLTVLIWPRSTCSFSAPSLSAVSKKSPIRSAGTVFCSMSATAALPLPRITSARPRTAPAGRRKFL